MTKCAFPFFRPSRWRAKNAGFTMVELMLVVVIIGILAALVAPRLGSGPPSLEPAVASSPSSSLHMEFSPDGVSPVKTIHLTGAYSGRGHPVIPA